MTKKHWIVLLSFTAFCGFMFLFMSGCTLYVSVTPKDKKPKQEVCKPEAKPAPPAAAIKPVKPKFPVVKIQPPMRVPDIMKNKK